MIDLEELQILAQLVDNIDLTIIQLEKAYERKNTEDFERAKREILDIQGKISQIVK